MEFPVRDRRPHAPGFPAELLSEIFLHCVDGGMDPINTIHTPLLITRICMRWRDAAIATPQLWSRLYLQLTYAEDGQTALVNTWLHRSGAYPLTLYISCEEPSISGYYPVLDALSRHSHRWEGIFFYMPLSAFRCLTRVRGKLPILKELSLGTGDEPSTVSNSNPLTVFEHAPKLRALECVNLSPFVFEFPWSQLTDIPLMAVTIDDVLDILRRSVHLDKAGFVFVTGGVRTPPPAVQHMHLRYFTVMTPPWNETVDLCQLFSQLTLPGLHNLTICNLHSPFGPSFIPFLSRLQSLHTLHLRKTAITDRFLLRSLAELPSLICLILLPSPNAAKTVTNYLLNSLTSWEVQDRRSDSPLLVPRLQKLEIQIDDMVAESFICMVQSRMMVDAEDQSACDGLGLKNIRVRIDGSLASGFLDQFEELRIAGLIVNIEDIAGANAAEAI